MDREKSNSNDLEDALTIEEKKKAFISQANVVKQDIDQLLMCLGANHDTSAIAQKMDQFGRNIADLYTHLGTGGETVHISRHGQSRLGLCRGPD